MLPSEESRANDTATFKIFPGELVNRGSPCHTPGFFGVAAEVEHVEILGHGCGNFFDVLLGQNHRQISLCFNKPLAALPGNR